MERKNNKRQLRRQAAQALAKLATDLHVPRSIDAKDPRAEDVEGLVRLLERRVQTPAHRQQLFAAAKQWEDNGGGLSAAVLQDAMDRPCVVHRHRVLHAVHNVIQPAVDNDLCHSRLHRLRPSTSCAGTPRRAAVREVAHRCPRARLFQ